MNTTGSLSAGGLPTGVTLRIYRIHSDGGLTDSNVPAHNYNCMHVLVFADPAAPLLFTDDKRTMFSVRMVEEHGKTIRFH
jgi:hypothetical protein